MKKISKVLVFLLITVQALAGPPREPVKEGEFRTEAGVSCEFSVDGEDYVFNILLEHYHSSVLIQGFEAHLYKVDESKNLIHLYDTYGNWNNFGKSEYYFEVATTKALKETPDFVLKGSLSLYQGSEFYALEGKLKLQGNQTAASKCQTWVH